MIRTLMPSDYLDQAYGPGVNVVVIYNHDDISLYRDAITQLELVDHRLHRVRLWRCLIESPEDAELVQVVRLPQVRFFMNGSERYSHLGAMEAEAILNRIFIVEEAG